MGFMIAGGRSSLLYLLSTSMEATPVKSTLCPFNLGTSCSPVGRKISKPKTNMVSVFCFVPCRMSANVCRFKQFQLFSPLWGLSCIPPLSSPDRERDGDQDKYICYQLWSGVRHGDGELSRGGRYQRISEVLPDSCWVFLGGRDYIYIS